TNQIHPSVPSGRVINQNPNSGTSVPVGSSVDLTVSLGPPEEPEGNWNAVIEVNESPYYAANKSSFWPGASLTDYYYPLPVFFEGWKSEFPEGENPIYEWDFGDDLPNGASIVRSGFNAS